MNQFKKVITVIAGSLLSILAVAQINTAAPIPDTVRITKQPGIIMRAKPGSRIVKGTAEFGLTYTVINARPTYLKVQLPNNKTGWVYIPKNRRGVKVTKDNILRVSGTIELPVHQHLGNRTANAKEWITAGKKYPIIDRHYGYLRIETSTQKTGWIYTGPAARPWVEPVIIPRINPYYEQPRDTHPLNTLTVTMDHPIAVRTTLQRGAPQIGTADPNQTYEILDRQPGYIQVILSDEVVGWVFINPRNPWAKRVGNNQIEITHDLPIPIRDLPAAPDGEVIGEIEPGHTYTFQRVHISYAKIKLKNGRTGWIFCGRPNSPWVTFTTDYYHVDSGEHISPKPNLNWTKIDGPWHFENTEISVLPTDHPQTYYTLESTKTYPKIEAEVDISYFLSPKANTSLKHHARGFALSYYQTETTNVELRYFPDEQILILTIRDETGIREKIKKRVRLYQGKETPFRIAVKKGRVSCWVDNTPIFLNEETSVLYGKLVLSSYNNHTIFSNLKIRD